MPEKETVLMTASSSTCPNCGGSMVMLRRDRQSTGQRDVVLEWMVCVACRHVRLDHWAFAAEVVGDETSRDPWQRAERSD